MTHEQSNAALLDTLYEEPGAYARTFKKSFACEDDILLLKGINSVTPWEAPSGQVMNTWADLAKDLRDNRRFRLTKDGPACKSRFEKLIKAHSGDSLAAMRRSGTDEEFGERDQLLEDISSQMEDHRVLKEAGSAVEAKKKNGIEKSGVIMRQLAMESLDDDDVGSAPRRSTPTKRDRVDQFFEKITESVEEMSRSDPAMSVLTTFMQESRKQDDEREEKRMRSEEEREERQYLRDLARDKQTQDFLLALVGMARQNNGQ
ncbi:hypothetical protein DYB36_003722 [Aphanomyces astaci]|uniref:Myb-like domain-containing protein n=1 Tax=Aphanomyces astaci TaxID=112090 RepID=A0A397AC44_APHAT|nr:hypothetical protein DYB36_003722 [Aphanomyces astaci]